MDYPYKHRYLDDVILSRRSVRAFRPTPVPCAVVEDILWIARHAPSGSNTQPWRVIALSGEVKEELSRRVLAIHNDPALLATHTSGYNYSPPEWPTPYCERRREIGLALYQRLGIKRSDLEARRKQQARNYLFFDAPVGLIFLIQRDLAIGSFLDYGMFLQNIMLAACARGLGTCAQGAFVRFHQVIKDLLKLPSEDEVVCAMALGYPDDDAPENNLVAGRIETEAFARFIGWESAS